MKLFGTGGIKGTAGKYPLDACTLVKIGQAIREVSGKILYSTGISRGVDNSQV